MKNPQTLAEELYNQFPNEKLRNIKDFGCCAFTLLWCLGIESDDAKAIMTLGQLIDSKAIEEDCTVLWAKACQYLTGRNLTVEFKNITSIKDIKKRTPVKYERIDENGNVTCVHCTYDPESRGGNSPDGRKVKGTLHWVSEADSFKAEVRLYDRLFNKENPSDESAGAFTEKELKNAALKAETESKLGATKLKAENGYYVLPIETYEDKTLAGLLAQFVGFMSGYEFVQNSDGSATDQDKYLTDPVPEGKPLPVEPENQEINKGKTYTCTFSIECSTILNNLSELDPDKLELVPSNGVILAPTTVTFYEGESVFDVLQRVCKDNNIHIEFSWTPIYNSAYIEGIHNLYEFDCGALSGWMYRVDGWYPNYGCSRYQLKDGDVVEWRYTCDLGNDVGGKNLF